MFYKVLPQVSPKYCALIKHEVEHEQEDSPEGKTALCGLISEDAPEPELILYTTRISPRHQPVSCPDCLKHPGYPLWELKQTEV